MCLVCRRKREETCGEKWKENQGQMLQGLMLWRTQREPGRTLSRTGSAIGGNRHPLVAAGGTRSW
jgi:hypothetical protein